MSLIAGPTVAHSPTLSLHTGQMRLYSNSFFASCTDGERCTCHRHEWTDHES
jgi:hypothetical protein